ncbi:hypothetical protein [Chitinophaga pinensis]|uniref:Uncharacterized protein n=1 Tax=Chitinophaga pinensis TaxID=79329 RepID=A0A5C6LN55_9BACT|nr:hypothetical protein [Chitinophaga pinensis]TWV97350.1 hypothetical protein FEF09_22065 [Chitinophaga pinensis]
MSYKELKRKMLVIFLKNTDDCCTFELNWKVKFLIGKIRPVMEMNKITYYSFQIDGDDLCEVEKFVTTFNKPAYSEDYLNIMSVIREMGMTRGAEVKYFRHERAAEALPPPYTSGDVRLYCSRISRDIVILGNGCVKTTQKVQQSKDCLFHFELVNALSTQITERITAGDLRIINKQFEGNLEFKIGESYE